MERIKKRTQSLMTLRVAQTSRADLSANETKARAYSHHGHGPRADQTGRIHISDFRHPADILLRNAAGPYIWVMKGSDSPVLACSASHSEAGFWGLSGEFGKGGGGPPQPKIKPLTQ